MALLFSFFSFDQIKKISFSREKNQLLNVYFLTLFYNFFFLRVGILFLFLTVSNASGLKRGFFFFYECCVFWAGGPGSK